MRLFLPCLAAAAAGLSPRLGDGGTLPRASAEPPLVAQREPLPEIVPGAEGAIAIALQRVADDVTRRFNCSIAMAFHSASLTASVAAGYTDAGIRLGSPTRAALPNDTYVWGSTTKMFTGAAVLKLLDEGKLQLSDSIATHADPFLIRVNGTRLRDHWGQRIEKVTIGELLHMQSGVQDYDKEPYTYAQFQERGHDFSPLEILSTYVPTSPLAPPGTGQMYSSTNYILLGLVLASHANATGWRGYDQRSVIPPALQPQMSRTAFVHAGRCSAFTPVHGFMQAYRAASLPPQDVHDLSCTGGWTAGNLIGPVDEIARFTRELYRPNGTILSAAAQSHLTNWGRTPFPWYGMATFNLGWAIGGGEAAYGHVGDTYGYQSQATYVPGLDASITVATNIESANQAQPGDATCLAYHAVVAALASRPAPRCEFVVQHFFFGSCICTDLGAQFYV